MADAYILNQIIWYSVRGKGSAMPSIVRLPVVDALRLGLSEETEAREKGSADSEARGVE